MTDASIDVCKWRLYGTLFYIPVGLKAEFKDLENCPYFCPFFQQAVKSVSIHFKP